MVCNKNQLVCGIQSFINDDMIPNITDKPVQMALFALSQFPNMITSVLEKPFMKMVLNFNEDTGTFDVDMLHKALSATMDKFGSFPLVINAIPFVLPTAVTISLTRSDVESLVGHIERSATYGT